MEVYIGVESLLKLFICNSNYYFEKVNFYINCVYVCVSSNNIKIKG